MIKGPQNSGFMYKIGFFKKIFHFGFVRKYLVRLESKIILNSQIFESGQMKIFRRVATASIFQFVNQVKTKPRLAGYQIPFGRTRHGFV
jgi:hypothetical protein